MDGTTAGAWTAGSRSGAKNPRLVLLNASSGGAAVGMVCSHVDVGEPKPVIGEDAVDFGGGLNYSCSLLQLTRRRGGFLRVGDFLGRVGKLHWRRVLGDGNGC